MHKIFKSMLMLFTKKLSKLVRAWQNYSLQKLARFLRQCIIFNLCSSCDMKSQM